MASLYKQSKYKKLPEGAEIIRRRKGNVARWIDGRGNRKEAPLSDDGLQILIDSGPYWAKYRDENGIVRRKSTDCRDKQSAEKQLQDWLLEVDQIRSGIVTGGQLEAKSHAQVPLTKHRADYLEYLANKKKRGRKTSGAHVVNVGHCLTRIMEECRFTRLADIKRDIVKNWIRQQVDEGKLSGRTINSYREAIISFVRWAVKYDRLLTNPLELLDTVDQSETRRNRRPLTATEIRLLLSIVRSRPLMDGMTVRRGPRKGQVVGKVKPSVRDRLDRLGLERYLIDLVMVYTGLPRSEVERLKVCDLHLNSPVPYIELRRSVTKNARAGSMPLRKDLVPHLAEWIAAKLGDAKLFHVPKGYVRSLDNDLIAARIPKEDSKGRTFDVHCFRHHFATQLELAGTTDRMIKRLLRHSDGSVTERYLHADLKEMSAAIETLPDYLGQSQPESAIATGTDEVIGKVGFVTDSKSMPRSMPRYAHEYAPQQSLPDIACQQQVIGSDSVGVVKSEDEGTCQSVAAIDEKADSENRTRMVRASTWRPPFGSSF